MIEWGQAVESILATKSSAKKDRCDRDRESGKKPSTDRCREGQSMVAVSLPPRHDRY
jgi:hypothetical protein